MKKYHFAFLFALLWLGCLATVQAQKFGYVNTEYVLNKMPEYQQAKQELDKITAEWQEQMVTMRQEIQQLYDDFRAEEVLLTAQLKEERLANISKKEKALLEFQTKVFGFDGLLFLKKKELVKPVQDKIFEAVQKVAQENRLQTVFDKSGSLVLLYTSPVHDYTDFVLEELGLGDPNDTVQR